MKIHHIILFIILTFFQFCTPDEGCKQNIFVGGGSAHFILLDNNGNDLVINRELFDADSIRLEVNGLNVIHSYQFIGTRENTYFYLDNFNTELESFNEELYFLHFGSQDIDTLRIITERKVNDCDATYSQINKVIHNSDTLSLIENSFGIIKNL